MKHQKYFIAIIFAVAVFSPGQNLLSQDLFIDSGKNLGEISSWSVAIADLDGDGDLDACVDGNIWLNNGAGIFSKSEKIIGSSTTVLGDLNGDGFIDAVCGNKILLNDGSYNFVEQSPTFGDSVYVVTLANLDSDNDFDVIACTQNSDRVWYNDGNGNFTDSGKNLGGWRQASYNCGDVNGDGITDIVVGIPHTPPPSMNDYINDKIWLGDGNGNFSGQVLPSVNFQTRGAVLKDFDNDNDLDLLMIKGYSISGGNNWSKILFNGGAGNFSDSGQKLNTGYNSSFASIADFDNDGDDDIFFCNGMPGDNGQPNTVWLNDGHGNFSDSGLRLGNSNTLMSGMGDFDNDGDIDLFVANVNLTTGIEHCAVYFNSTISATGIDNNIEKLQRSFNLHQNYPNPCLAGRQAFNPSTQICYSLTEPSLIKLEIFDTLGQKIKTLVDSFQHTGEHYVVWNATDDFNYPVSSGVYFYSLTANEMSYQKKMILTR